jgi:hypothetical protein
MAGDVWPQCNEKGIDVFYEDSIIPNCSILVKASRSLLSGSSRISAEISFTVIQTGSCCRIWSKFALANKLLPQPRGPYSRMEIEGYIGLRIGLRDESTANEVKYQRKDFCHLG